MPKKVIQVRLPGGKLVAKRPNVDASSAVMAESAEADVFSPQLDSLKQRFFKGQTAPVAAPLPPSSGSGIVRSGKAGGKAVVMTDGVISGRQG